MNWLIALLMIILSPVILFVGASALFIVLTVIAFIFGGIVLLILWVVDKLTPIKDSGVGSDTVSVKLTTEKQT